MYDDEKYMRRCIELARLAAQNGDVPVGALIVKNDSGEIIAEGYNRREADRSSLSHAELIAIDAASKRLGGWRLMGCTLYVTLEPCAMCAGAIVNSRLERLVFGADDMRFGACGSSFDLFAQRLNHVPQVEKGVLKEECAQLLSDFFRQLRKRSGGEGNNG